MNILIVVEKTYIKNIILEIIKENVETFTDNYYFALSNFITHENDDCLKIRYVNGEYFQQRTKLENVKPLCLNDINIPEHTFLNFQRDIKTDEISFDKIDKIICFCDKDECGILGFKKYTEDNNLKDTFIYPLVTLEKENIYNGLLNHFSFDKVWEETKKYLISSNFQADYPRKCDVYKLRKNTNMTRKEFADYFNIPYRTVENWEFDINLCPQYLFDLMCFKLKTENFL